MVERVYMAVSLRSKGAYLLSPAFLIAAVSTCRTTPTCQQIAPQSKPNQQLK
jgi:hypothetical protein